MVFLQGHGISPALAVRIWKRYGTRSPTVLRENPYVLAEEVAGIAFPTADAIARKLGVPEDAPARLEAAILHALAAAADEGHVWQAREQLAAACAKLTGAAEAMCEAAVATLAARGAIALEEVDGPTLAALPRLAGPEQAAAAIVTRLAAAAHRDRRVDAAASIAAFERIAGITLSSLPARGGPGRVRKSAAASSPAVRARARPRSCAPSSTHSSAGDLRVLLCAPTGRAAEATRRGDGPGGEDHPPAPRVQRPGGFERNAGPAARGRCRHRRRDLDGRHRAVPRPARGGADGRAARAGGRPRPAPLGGAGRGARRPHRLGRGARGPP